MLADGQRLAGQQGFVGGEVDAGGKTEIGGNDVADIEADDVAWHECLGLDGGGCTGPDDFAGGRRQGVQSLNGLLGAIVLQEADEIPSA